MKQCESKAISELNTAFKDVYQKHTTGGSCWWSPKVTRGLKAIRRARYSGLLYHVVLASPLMEHGTVVVILVSWLREDIQQNSDLTAENANTATTGNYA